MGRFNRANAEAVVVASAIEGGASAFFNDAVTAAVTVKSSQGQLYHLKLVNTTAAVAYLQIFGAPSGSVVLGTTAASWTIRLAASESVNISLPTPLALAGSGISVAGTTTPTGAVGAAVSVSLLFG